MIILDDSYVSDRMLEYLGRSGQAVLESPMARQLARAGATLNLVPEAQAVARVDAGERLYAMSESHFAWVAQNISHPGILHGLSVFKDKARMRELLAPMYPNYYFATFSCEELLDMPYPALRAPFVVKPSVGFLSLGVFVVRSEADWDAARAQIAAQRGSWAQWYSEAVIGSGRFILESLLEGPEYALDAYFDAQGRPHLLNVLRHDFANAADTSDRLYSCGKQIMLEKRRAFLRFLAQANELAGVRDFPVHVELRESDGQIVPIEFNALRFAGLGGTEISQMAFGFYTFDMYLRDEEPNWEAAFAHSGDDLYCMSVLNPPAGTPAKSSMDYDAFWAQWRHPLALDRFDYDKSGILGFLFWKTSAEDDSERRRLLNDDLSAFLIKR